MFQISRDFESHPQQDIQEATASEPLTLDEEYAMQQSWRVDPDKLTFIICRPGDNEATARDGQLDIDAMIGDANLFLSVAEDDTENQIVVGELELMVAVRTEQRKGYGRAALLAFLNYVVRHERSLLSEFHAAQPKVGLSRLAHFAVKIGVTNHRSIALFEGLGFRKTSDVSSYFGEFELRLSRDEIEAVLESSTATGRFLEGYREMEYLCP